MSTRIMALVWPLQMAPGAKAVLVSLADQANDDGVCWPRISTIAERTCFSERSVTRALNELADIGALTVVRTPGRLPRYVLTPDKLSPPDPRQVVTPHPRQIVRGVVPICQGGGDTVSPPSDPSLIRHGSDPLVRFDEFWSVYPRKRSKGAAEKAWAKLKPSEQLADAILAAVGRAKTSVQWLKDGGEFIPHPATWLNRRGWEDEHQEQTDGARIRSGGASAVDRVRQATGLVN